MKKAAGWFAFVALLLAALCVSAGAANDGRPYTEDENIKIIDHVVYCKVTYYENAMLERGARAEYEVKDFFDTDAAAKRATQVRVVGEIDGIPVKRILTAHQQDASRLGWENGNVYGKRVETISLPDSLEWMSPFAFCGFSALKSMVLPSGITEIPAGAFCGCEALETVKIKGKVTAIGERAFEDCRNLRALRLPNTVESIGVAAFRQCRRLETMNFPAALRELGPRALEWTALKAVTLPAGLWTGASDEAGWVESVFGNIEGEYGQFANCTALTRVAICGNADEALWIPPYCFKNCTALTTVTLPKTTKGVCLQSGAFYGCSKLSTVNHAATITQIDDAFENCASLQKLTLGTNVNFVSPHAFYGCGKLKTLVIESTDPAIFSVQTNEVVPLIVEADLGQALRGLPQNATVVVRTAKMKKEALRRGVQCAVKVKVFVAAPKALKAAVKQKSVTLKWSAVKGASGYRVYVYNTKTQQYEKLKTLKGTNAVSYTIPGARAGKYIVKAYNVIGGDVSWSKASPMIKVNSR